MTINLVVPEDTDVCLLEEFDIIRKWAVINTLHHINVATTQQIVFRRPNPYLDVISHSLDYIERLEEAKLLGVFSVITYILKLVLIL